MKKNPDAKLRTGAMALAAAGASTAAHAATVQITFNNSYISTTSGNHLVTDFGGDNTVDIRYGLSVYAATVRAANAISAPPVAFGGQSIDMSYVPVASVNGIVVMSGGTVAQASVVAAFTLGDANVRGGAATSGWLDVSVTGRSSGELGRVVVHRFVFDDASGVAPAGVSHSSAAYPAYVAAVPEPSGLGLLALGAGGLLARRRRAMAA